MKEEWIAPRKFTFREFRVTDRQADFSRQVCLREAVLSLPDVGTNLKSECGGTVNFAVEQIKHSLRLQVSPPTLSVRTGQSRAVRPGCTQSAYRQHRMLLHVRNAVQPFCKPGS